MKAQIRAKQNDWLRQISSALQLDLKQIQKQLSSRQQQEKAIMLDTQKFDNFGGGHLTPLPGKSTAIARTFNHLVSIIASLQEFKNQCLKEQVDHPKKP